MKKIISSLVMFVVACLFFVSCASQQVTQTSSNHTRISSYKKPAYQKEDVRKYDSIKIGNYSGVMPVPMKDYVVKGMIFVESKVTIDVNGERIGSEITNEMLMKQAQKLGADDVINVRIDEITDHKIVDKFDKDGKFIGRDYKQYNYIYKATGLAIKYTNAIISDTNFSVLLNTNKKSEEKPVNNNKKTKISLPEIK